MNLSLKHIFKLSFMVVGLILAGQAIKSQNLSEEGIRDLASKIDNQLRGKDIGNGVIVRSCVSAGRTVFYSYDLPTASLVSMIRKEDVISNMKTAEYDKFFYLNKLNATYNYFYGSQLIKTIRIDWSEFSGVTQELGSYVSLLDYPKSKGLNVKFQPPEGWEEAIGLRPHVAFKTGNGTNYFMVLVHDNVGFTSRNEARELLADSEFVDEFIDGIIDELNIAEVFGTDIVSLDNYPAIRFSYVYKGEQAGLSSNIYTTSYFVFYEDLFVSFQFGCLSREEYQMHQPLFMMVANSVVFPDQYSD